jgi:ABC-type glutathione transport system ATPase component
MLMQPEILPTDEWFRAGDADCIARAGRRLEQPAEGADILVIATHDMAVMRRRRSPAIRLEGGGFVADGPVAEVIGAEPLPASRGAGPQPPRMARRATRPRPGGPPDAPLHHAIVCQYTENVKIRGRVVAVGARYAAARGFCLRDKALWFAPHS